MVFPVRLGAEMVRSASEGEAGAFAMGLCVSVGLVTISCVSVVVTALQMAELSVRHKGYHGERVRHKGFHEAETTNYNLTNTNAGLHSVADDDQ